jgi:hypothetical protein
VPRFEAFTEKEERIVRKTEEKGSFFHDLEYGLLDGSSMRVRQRIEIKADNRNAV